MISATSLNAPNALNKGHQIPIGLENGRLRVDSQKFLVPSLPVSARGVGLHHDPKRRERSIINGTAHPSPPTDYSQHHHQLSHNYPNNINGFRQSYNHNLHGGTGGRDNSPNSPHNNSNSNHRTSSSPHHPYLHLSKSPRKDAHSPMYAGEVPGLSPGSGGNYSPRSSMPIPCSSPAQASSASPKGSHSHSPSGTVAAGNYSPKLPSGPAMLPPPTAGANELNALASAGRLYPGFPPPHPSVAAHLSPAFYAAAAAAAASHSLPYPLFGPHYNPHSHSAAAASAYLDSFHSALVNRGPNSEMQQRSRSPSPSPPNRSHGAYHSAQPHPQQQSHHHGPGPNSHQSTSVTSLHNKLIESIAVSSDRHHYNGHHHSHNNHVPSGQFSPPQSLGISKGGPLGISGGIMNLPSTRMSSGVSPHKHSGQPENLIVHKPPPGAMNGYHMPSKQWMEHHGLNHNDPLNRKLMVEMEANEARHSQHKEGPHKHRGPLHSPPQDMSVPHSPKASKSISFANDTYPPPNLVNNRFPNPNNFHHPNSSPYAHINGHHSQIVQNNPQSSHGILTDSNHAKKQLHLQHSNQMPNSHPHHLSHQSQPPQNQFLPPSPKKRTAPWNFAVPANPTSKVDLPPPPPPPPLNHSSHNHAEHLKYLNSNQNLNHKPSNQQHLTLPVPNSATSAYLLSGQSAQHSYPSSPRLPGSGPSTPKSPSVHQVKFNFSNGSSKENVYGINKNGNKIARNDSSSSTSSNEGNVPWPVEQMPMLDAFRRGSLIKLANGVLRPVEDLKAEDFIQSVANMSGTLKIIHCTVLAIQQSDGNNGNSMCKVTMTAQLQNQQVVVPSTPEQPFFVMGRGWSSLSPKTTEKLLQLPCYPLAVGDVCITLSKTTGASHSSSFTAATKSQQQVPKSPSTRGRKPGSRNANNAINCPTVKKAQQIPAPIFSKPVGDNQGGKSAMPLTSNPESIKRHSMRPPLTTTVPSSPTTVVNAKAKEIASAEDMDSLGPPSPKRRRWSAPEPEISVSTTPPAVDDADKSSKDKEKETVVSPPLPPKAKSPVSLPLSEKDEPTIIAESDRKASESLKRDLNSNVNVVDCVGAINVDQRRPPDAQSAKA